MKRKERNQIEQNYGPMDDNQSVNRTVYCPYPQPTQPVYAVPLTAQQTCTQYGIGPVMSLPEYVCTDEYGRVYKARISYGPMQGAGPVPIATPSQIVQTPAINVPVNFSR